LPVERVQAGLMPSINWSALFWGALGAVLVDALGRPQGAKLVLPVIGRMPTLAAGDATKPGLLEGMMGGSPTQTAAG
jgi:hypothetical protein